MRASRTNNGNGQEYLVMFRIYVQSDGSMVVIMGNQQLELSADETCALLYGTLDYAKVFAKLHEHIDATTLAILNENSMVNGQE